MNWRGEWGRSHMESRVDAKRSEARALPRFRDSRERVIGDLMGGDDTSSNSDDRWQQTTRGRHVHEKWK